MNGVENIKSVLALAALGDIEGGKTWYHRANAETLSLHPNEIVATSIVAVLSPGLRWDNNVEAARQVITYERMPKGVGRVWPANYRKAIAILRGENAYLVLGGNKVRAFWHCILEPNNKIHVCIDGHAYAIWKGERITVENTPNITNNLYSRISSDYAEASLNTGLSPCQLQAITWCAWRRVHGVDKPGEGRLTNKGE